MLKIKDLRAKVDGKRVLDGLNLEIGHGEVHILMGPNGSGKSSLAHIIMGDERYKVDGGEMKYGRRDLMKMEVEERAKQGIFLAYQNPVALTGVTVFHMMKKSYEVVREESMSAVDFRKKLESVLAKVGLPKNYYKRYVNDGFSGGEKKRLELAQMMMLSPKLAILDEIDSGLDIDSLKIVGDSVGALRKKGSSIVIITHYGRVADYIAADYVHVMKKGKIGETGGRELVGEVEKTGYGRR